MDPVKLSSLIARMMRHAFLSGVVAARNIPGHEEVSAPKLWKEYEPYPQDLAKAGSVCCHPRYTEGKLSMAILVIPYILEDDIEDAQGHVVIKAGTQVVSYGVDTNTLENHTLPEEPFDRFVRAHCVGTPMGWVLR